MLKLNENEKIDSWDVVVRTTEGRELSCCDLGLDLPYTGTKRIDQTLEQFYPCSWNSCEHSFVDDDNDGSCGMESCRYCGFEQKKV